MILVTGGAGFIGSHVVEFLIDKGKKVRVLDDLSAGAHNIQWLKKKPQVEFMQGDISSQSIVDSATKDCEAIIHLAAMNRAPRSIEDPIRADEINIRGTLLLLEAASQQDNIDRFVFSSSSSVYGRSPHFPRKEDDITLPEHPYGVGKLTCEHYCNVYYRLFGLKTVILRLFSVYGPRQNPHIQHAAVIPLFIITSLEHRPVTIYGSGEQQRNFTYVRDVAQMLVTALFKPDVVGETINIASTESCTVNNLAQLISAELMCEIRFQSLPQRQGDPLECPPDVTKMEQLFNIEYITPLKEGIPLTVQWFKRNPQFFD